MINRRGNTRIEWYDVDVLLWGSIVPPEAGTGSWYWDVWGPGPRGQKQQPYLDIGASGLYARKFWGTQLYMQENYTSGTTSGLHGGFHTQVSGLYPNQSFNLATKGYVDYSISTIQGGSLSLSGLADVYDGPWNSGLFVSWNGLEFVPAFASAVTGSGNGNYSEVFTASNFYQVNHNLQFYPQTTLLNSGGIQIEVQVTHLSTSGLLLDFFGTITSGRIICDTTSGTGGGISLSGNYQLSGAYITSSGNWEISGTSATLDAGLSARFQASGLYQAAGNYQLSGAYITTTTGDVRYALAGTGGGGSLPGVDIDMGLFTDLQDTTNIDCGSFI